MGGSEGPHLLSEEFEPTEYTESEIVKKFNTCSEKMQIRRSRINYYI